MVEWILSSDGMPTGEHMDPGRQEMKPLTVRPKGNSTQPGYRVIPPMNRAVAGARARRRFFVKVRKMSLKPEGAARKVDGRRIRSPDWSRAKLGEHLRRRWQRSFDVTGMTPQTTSPELSSLMVGRLPGIGTGQPGNIVSEDCILLAREISELVANVSEHLPRAVHVLQRY